MPSTVTLKLNNCCSVSVNGVGLARFMLRPSSENDEIVNMPALVLCPVILTVSPTAKLSSVQTPRFRVTNWALGLSTMKLSASAWSAVVAVTTTSTALLWVFSEVKVISRPLRSRRVRVKPSAEMESIRKTPLLLMLCAWETVIACPGRKPLDVHVPPCEPASDGLAGERAARAASGFRCSSRPTR